MTQQAFSRRGFIVAGAALGAVAGLPVAATRAPLEIHVMKDPNCGCCSAWIEILEADGFKVSTETSFGTALSRYKTENGIPARMASCHTAKIAGYMIEGHVPAADIRALLETRPDAVGLSVPGMPYGSPGMGPEDRREAYDVYLIGRDGGATVFSSYPAA
ncbi:DUF411 domain-containing protein [Roseovarius sp. EGI FJ00037]|uniref:DUF411 domain-containing protein n=1 Tax=Roseovarius salincola TaxID=2978479 RepID=UPI0022A85EB1|nr:DUF411 domain-containing protein [Roseovarius sp. EGI FJ00037]MCZ0812929.1 DUF411 domain-containing protein [Roseovarius sp. EGI FJ00037]